MFDSIIYRIPASVLMDLYRFNETNVTELVRRLNSPFSYVLGTVDQFEEGGLLESMKRGRDRRISLTKKGKSIARNLSSIKMLLQY